MASSNISLEAVKSALREKGFYSWEDGATGERVAEMEIRGFPYLTECGLDFCAETAFDLVSPLPGHSFGPRLRHHSAYNPCSKNYLTDVSLHTGSDTKNIRTTSNASGGVALKLVVD